jgi:hypothetical protein
LNIEAAIRPVTKFTSSESVVATTRLSPQGVGGGTVPFDDAHVESCGELGGTLAVELHQGDVVPVT